MTTTETSSPIACPSWCTVTEAGHRADLERNDHDVGVCHHAITWTAADLPRVTFSTVADPAGSEQSTVFCVDDRELTLSQLEDVADAIREAVATYRATYGAERAEGH